MPERAAGQDRQGDRGGTEAGRLDDRLGVRTAQGVHHSYRTHGRSHGGRTRRAPGAAERPPGVTPPHPPPPSPPLVSAATVPTTGHKLPPSTPPPGPPPCPRPPLCAPRP